MPSKIQTMRLAKLLLFILGSTSIHSYAQDGDKAGSAKSGNLSSCCAHGECCEVNPVPAGIMTDHIHAKGKWMVSYTYMDMMMSGSRAGMKSVSADTLYKSYMMAPSSMSMRMHMLMVMYGITDRFTAMVMAGYASNDMKMTMLPMIMPGDTIPSSGMGTTSSGFSDTKLYGLYNFSRREGLRFIGSFGVNLPTGTIRAKGTTVLGDNQRLPYGMQLGAGSFSIIPGLTVVREFTKLSFGADAGADVKLNKNSLGYTAGNNYHVTAWGAYKVTPSISGSLRAEWLAGDKINGSDSLMNIPVYQLSDPMTVTANYGGTWVNMYIGFNFHLNRDIIKRFNLQLEYGVPVYENVNGTQSSLRANFLAGLQYSF